jgi:DNA-binding MarR family transcriptional regulator
VTPDIDPTVVEIDQAAFALRRLWSKPPLVRHLREQGSEGRPIQLSNLMVINVVAQLNIEGAGDVTVGAVAERLDIDPSTASRLVGHAIDAGFVSRRPSPVDARRVDLSLTEAGDRVKAATDVFRRCYIGQLVADWSERDRAEFARLLRRFTDAAANTVESEGMEKIFEAAEHPEP